MLEKLIKIFRANSAWHLLIIFIIFGITGSLSVYLSGPILELLRLDDIITNLPLYWFIRILVITISYQLSLLVIATLFGEFKYFLRIQKKFLNRFRLINRK